MSNNCAYLVILISSHCNEIRFRENISPEGTVREFENIVGPHNVKSRLIFVHGVKYGLQKIQSQKKGKKVTPLLMLYLQNISLHLIFLMLLI